MSMYVYSLRILYIYEMLKARNNNVGLLEHRTPLMVPGALLVPIGFFWYGWSINAHAHWILPNIGATLFGAGIIISMHCITSYIIDSYGIYTASTIAATTVLRALAGFGVDSLILFMFMSPCVLPLLIKI